jgi:hypothetical protein
VRKAGGGMFAAPPAKTEKSPEVKKDLELLDLEIVRKEFPTLQIQNADIITRAKNKKSQATSGKKETAKESKEASADPAKEVSKAAEEPKVEPVKEEPAKTEQPKEESPKVNGAESSSEPKSDPGENKAP